MEIGGSNPLGVASPVGAVAGRPGGGSGRQWDRAALERPYHGFVPVHPSAATGFAAAASRYQRGRPGYPAVALEWTFARAGLGPGSAVVELGAGTGKLTQELVRRGLLVTAVEPVAQMAGELSARLPGIPVCRAAAESTGLPGGAARAVLAAQAFHWFANPDAVREIRRLLRPRGWLILIWNRRDDHHPVWREVARLLAPLRSGEPTHEKDEWRAALGEGAAFGPIRHRRFPNQVASGRRALVDRVLSISYVASQPPGERRRIEAALAGIWEQAAGGGRSALLPYHTDVFLTQVGDGG